MPDPNAALPPRYLRTPEAARFLGLSGRTLEKHRTYGTGPKYSKIGGRVVYAGDIGDGPDGDGGRGCGRAGGGLVASGWSRPCAGDCFGRPVAGDGGA